MDNEKIEATMQFILEQQAQIAANFQKAEEAREKDSARTKAFEESFAFLGELTKNLDERTLNHNERLMVLTEAQIRAEEHFRKVEVAREKDAARIRRLEESFVVLVQLAESHDERLVALTQAQIRTDEQLRETDERLNALIAIVERYLSNRDKNGSANN